MKKIFTIAFLLMASNIFAQKNIDFSNKNFPKQQTKLIQAKLALKQGNLFLDDKNYKKALANYQNAYDFNSQNADLNYKMGYCYLQLKQKKYGLDYLKKAAQLYDEMPDYLKYALARSNHLNYNFEAAQVLYSKLYNASDDGIFTKYMSECVAGMKLVENKIDNVIVKNMGTAINSEFNEYSPYVLFDGNLYFTASGNRLGAEYFDDDIYCSKKNDSTWMQAKRLGKPINTNGNDVILGCDNAKKIMYIYSDENNGDIFYSQNDKLEWSEPLRLDPEIISADLETEPVFSADGNTIYFLSDREGSLGEKDIFYANKKGNGSWTSPQNLGNNINTMYDEQSLFMKDDTLYFASEGHNSMGGYDIFYAVKQADGTFSSPVNMGYPINTPADDLYLSIVDENRKLLSSDREGTYGLSDIFLVQKLKPFIPEPDTVEVVAEKEEEPVKMIFVHNFTFPVDKTQNPEAYPTLDSIADFMLNEPDAELLIIGYTDESGSKQYNHNLSLKRAEFAQKYLISKGVDASAMKVEGRGEDNPIAVSKNKQRKYVLKSFDYNRRVEFIVTKQGEKSNLVVKPVPVPEEFKATYSKGKTDVWYSEESGDGIK